MKFKKQIIKLATLLGIGGVTGPVAVAAASGLFKPENALMIAILFMAGPGAILVASMLEGDLKTRMFSALFAGAIATLIVMLSAGFGPKLLELVNLNILKISGGIGILLIGLLIMGLKIPEKSPLIVMILGVIVGVVLR